MARMSFESIIAAYDEGDHETFSYELNGLDTDEFCDFIDYVNLDAKRVLDMPDMFKAYVRESAKYEDNESDDDGDDGDD